MTLRALGVALIGVLALTAAPARAQTGTLERPTLVPAGAPKFPSRAYRLTVPEKRRLAAGQLKVTENGEPVRGVSLASASGGNSTDFGTVLVIDASKSMGRREIDRAMQAGREIAAQRASNQQLGVVIFNRKQTVLADLTIDQEPIDRALSATPKLAPQRRIFDAVDVALDMLAKASITAGSIIVLSDGAELYSDSVGAGGTTTAPVVSAVGTRARKSNVRIFTVGLRSRNFDRSQLRDLARAGRGRYYPLESVEDLRPIFRQLGAELASEYLIRYRSETNAGRRVTVAVRVEGVDGVATAAYTVPGGASFVLVDDSFWTSTLGIITTALLCALLVAVGMAILLGRRHRGPDLRDRVQGFVSSLGEIGASGEIVSGQSGPGAAERSLERMAWWPAFKENCEIARIEMDPLRIVLFTGIGTLLTMYVLAKVAGPLAALAGLAIPLAVRGAVKFKLSQQRRLFADQLPDVLQGCASAIRAGHGLTGAIAMVTDDAPEPSRKEFLRVVADERLGVPLDDALRVVQRRMDSRDVQQIALVAQLQRDTGGNMAEVLDRVTESLRRSAELRRMVRSLTAQGRLSGWVVTALPIVLLIFVTVTNPDYVNPLYTEPGGRLMLGFAALLMVSGSLVIRKIVDFKV